MKQFTFKLLFTSILVLSCFASHGITPSKASLPSPEKTLTRYETQLFARVYSTDKLDNRLKRLENAVFGQVQTGTLSARLQRLTPFFKLATAPTMSEKKQPLAAVKPMPENLPETNRYPAVEQMETKVLGRVFPQESLESRLTTLEQKVLGRPQQGSLQERTDQLRLMVLGDPQTAHPREQAADPDPVGTQNSPQALQDVANALPAIEQRILGRAYDGEAVEGRLSRLEKKLFNAAAPELSAQDRLYRIASVINADEASVQEDSLNNGANSVGQAPFSSQFGQGPMPFRSFSGSGMSVGLGNGSYRSSNVTSVLLNMMLNMLTTPSRSSLRP
jgi:hypothetical protein